MTFTVNTITACAAGTHLKMNITVGTKTIDVLVNKSDLALDPDEIQTVAMGRMRSAFKESGQAATLAGLRAALEGKTFQI